MRGVAPLWQAVLESGRAARRLGRNAVARLAHAGQHEGDPADIRLRKSLLVLGSVMFIAAGAAWGLFYFVFSKWLAGAIPLGYAVVSTLSLATYSSTRNYALYRTSQLLLILILPFLLQIALGGFVNSSAVVLWSLICPIGALVFEEPPRSALRWFLAYVGLVALSAVLQPHLQSAGSLPSRLVVLMFVLNISAISGIAFVLIAYFIAQRDAAYQLLHLEQEKSENLLLNMLPRQIAATLKNTGGTIADYYGEVTVLFADIVNFTPFSAQIPPRELVDILNGIYTHFDILVDRYPVEKIAIVGDEYMAASGVPQASREHATATAQLALDMQAFIARQQPVHGRRLDIRIGIHSGPVVAGVIGRKKYAFELFGDTVNTAHRMQSHGIPGAIQISRDTYLLIKDDFVCERRGMMAIKGKGQMETWLLVRRKE